MQACIMDVVKVEVISTSAAARDMLLHSNALPAIELSTHCLSMLGDNNGGEQ